MTDSAHQLKQDPNSHVIVALLRQKRWLAWPAVGVMTGAQVLVAAVRALAAKMLLPVARTVVTRVHKVVARLSWSVQVNVNVVQQATVASTQLAKQASRGLAGAS